MTYEEIEQFLRDEVAAMTGAAPETVGAETALLGPARVIDSADLVMLLLTVEEFSSEQLGTVFDWSSDSAMSEARSVLRSVGSLARHLETLQSERQDPQGAPAEGV